VQWAGTRTLGCRAARSSSTRGMIGSKNGPAEMEPTEQAVQWLVVGEPSGVAGDVGHTSGAAPGWYHEPFVVRISAWSSRTRGSVASCCAATLAGMASPVRIRWCAELPPVTSTDRLNKKLGCCSSMTPKPACSSARRLVVRWRAVSGSRGRCIRRLTLDPAPRQRRSLRPCGVGGDRGSSHDMKQPRKATRADTGMCGRLELS
jgi:hypothetical protein